MRILPACIYNARQPRSSHVLPDRRFLRAHGRGDVPMVSGDGASRLSYFIPARSTWSTARSAAEQPQLSDPGHWDRVWRCVTIPRKIWKDGKIVRSPESIPSGPGNVAKSQSVASWTSRDYRLDAYDELGPKNVEPLFADPHTTPAAPARN